MYRNGEHKLTIRLVFPLVYIVRKFEKEKEVKTMKIKIERLPSGFYCVRVNGQWVDAASANMEQAKAKANEVIQRENDRQNKRNLFTNISIEYAL